MVRCSGKARTTNHFHINHQKPMLMNCYTFFIFSEKLLEDLKPSKSCTTKIVKDPIILTKLNMFSEINH
ncbi:MAG: hypothetical protein U5L45_02340 [Saprospiraceae bacterium]|nr:hypothetical protein [Saprospiraceae bacterium]